MPKTNSFHVQMNSHHEEDDYAVMSDRDANNIYNMEDTQQLSVAAEEPPQSRPQILYSHNIGSPTPKFQSTSNKIKGNKENSN